MKCNDAIRTINKAERKALKSSDSVRTLHVTCYDEQLTKAWAEIQSMIKEIDPNLYQVLAICHDRDEAKKHYHFIIKVLGNAKKAVSTLLEMVGVQFRETDQVLWNNGGVDRCHNFPAMCLYLTHETPLSVKDGRILYEVSEIVSNLSEAAVGSLRKNEATLRTLIEKIRYKVAYEGMTVKEVREQYPQVYIKDSREIERMRNLFLSNQPTPEHRYNIYVGGDGSGLGKSLFCIALARAIVDPDGKLTDDELIFEVKKETRFNKYKGQPVLLWDDFRPIDLFNAFDKSYGALFNFLEPHPRACEGTVNVKYDSIKLAHKVNIFNSPLDPLTWLDGIAGEYDRFDGTHIEAEAVRKDQIMRRIPLAFYLDLEGYTSFTNKGVIEGTREFGLYDTGSKICGNLAKVIDAIGAGKEYDQIASRFVGKAFEAYRNIAARMNKSNTMTDEEKAAFVAEQMETIGTVLNGETSPAPAEIPHTLTREGLEDEIANLRWQLNNVLLQRDKAWEELIAAGLWDEEKPFD